MDWDKIVTHCRYIREKFDRSHKCLNTDRPTSDETVNKHLINLFQSLEEIRVLLNVNYGKFSTAHKTAAESFFSDVRGRLISVAARRGIDIELPTTHQIEIKLPSFLVTNEPIMSQTPIEFLNTASRLVPEFDGKPENLRSFTDSLRLLDSLKGTHETVAVSLIKTKLKGHARNLVNEETTINQIINTLNKSVKGESVDVLSAKIQNVRQNNKSANAYCSEIESLTKSLEGAYISDGLPCELAAKYSTQVAVKAMSTNCNLEKVKLIMEAGKFDNMNEAVGKFISSCTAATGQQNTVLYYGQRPNNNRNRRNDKRFRGRGGSYRNQNNRGYNENNGRGRQGRGRNSYNRGAWNNNNDNNVRTTHTDETSSENPNTPLR